MYRLAKEYKDLSKEPLEESMFVAGPISEDDFYEWEALVVGPEGTPYASRARFDMTGVSQSFEMNVERTNR
jgi:ubiquitin-protein ligase